MWNSAIVSVSLSVSPVDGCLIKAVLRLRDVDRARAGAAAVSEVLLDCRRRRVPAEEEADEAGMTIEVEAVGCEGMRSPREQSCCAQHIHDAESIRRDASNVAALCGTHSSGRVVEFQLAAAQLTQRIQTAAMRLLSCYDTTTTNSRQQTTAQQRRTHHRVCLLPVLVTADRYQPSKTAVCHQQADEHPSSALVNPCCQP